MAAPRASPASTGRRRCRATRPSSISATTGMSSPPVARGSAAVGRTVRTWRARTRASVGGRSRLRANRATTTVNSRNWMRASVRRASTLLPLEKPKMTMPGQVGVVELVDRLGVLVDEDVAVAVDHPVGVLAVGGPDAGLLHHQHLGLDVEGGVALGAPRPPRGRAGTTVAPNRTIEEGHHPGGPPPGRRWPRRGAGPASGRRAVEARPTGCTGSATATTAMSTAGHGVGPDGHLAPLAVERDADGQRR